MRLLLIIALLMTLLLQGCTTGSIFTPGFEQPRESLNSWTLTGRIGIRTPDAAESANLFWRQQAEHYQLKLSGPLGMGSINIDGSPRHIEFQQQGKDPLSGDNAEQLIYQQTGWQLPVTAMQYWVQGLASPDLSIDQSQYYPPQNSDDSSGNTPAKQPLASLQQQDWTIAFKRYQTVDGILLPEKIIISHQNLRVTLLINQWRHIEQSLLPR